MNIPNEYISKTEDVADQVSGYIYSYLLECNAIPEGF